MFIISRGGGGVESTEVALELLIQRPRVRNTARIFSLAVVFLSLDCLVHGQYYRDRTHLVLSNGFRKCSAARASAKYYNKNVYNIDPCVPVNCVDRHVDKNPDKVALIWEKDEPGQQEYVTYR